MPPIPIIMCYYQLDAFPSRIKKDHDDIEQDTVILLMYHDRKIR